MQSTAPFRSLIGVECYACGRPLALGPERRVGFRAECEGCRADLHACRGCRHHAAEAYNECRESQAERVLDKQRANRCEYFAPAETEAGESGASATERARADLDRLFRK